MAATLLLAPAPFRKPPPPPLPRITPENLQKVGNDYAGKKVEVCAEIFHPGMFLDKYLSVTFRDGKGKRWHALYVNLDNKKFPFLVKQLKEGDRLRCRGVLRRIGRVQCKINEYMTVYLLEADEASKR
jgi:hypothetical protein